MMAPFKKMENITSFTDACRMLGVNESSMFATPDLYEEKNMGSVINCIYTFGGVIQSTVPDFTGPKLGIMINAQVKDGARSKQMATQTGGFAGTLDQQSAVSHARDVTFGAGKNATHNRHDGQPVQTPENAGGPVQLLTGEELYGLDKELKAKIDSKYDADLDHSICDWIEQVTRSQKGDQSTAEWLKDGQVLCNLANCLKPKSISNITTSKMPFKQMENIKEFIGFARDLGMAESSLFSTLDLFEEKNMPVVLMALYNLGGTVQVKVPEFPGPHLGTAVKAEIRDGNRGLALVTDQNEAMQRHMEIGRPRDGGVAFGAHQGATKWEDPK